MKKSSTTTDLVEFVPLYSFYRPHSRVQFTNEVINPVTGEVSQMPSMTKQSFVAQCDINNILKQFKLTGQINHISANAARGVYQDLPDELDLQSALNTVIAAETAFDSLPSAIRSRFENDPAQFLAFMSDPANQDEAIKLGLATKRVTDAPKEPQAPSVPSPAPPVPDGSGNAPAA